MRKKITGRKNVKNAASRLRQKSSCSVRSSWSHNLIAPRLPNAHGRPRRKAASTSDASFGELQVDVLERRPAHLEALDLRASELVDQLVQPPCRLLRALDDDLAVAA